MTIKELITFTGKTERTIRRWINKADLVGYDKMSQGYEIDYSIDEIEKILNAGSMSRDAIIILMGNARRNMELENKPTQIITVKENNSVDYIEIGKMIAIAVTSAMAPILQELRQPQQNQPKQLSLLVVPDIKPRAYLNQLVREYSQLKSVDFKKGWNVLYTEILYRCKENIKVKANHEGIKPIDYLEREGKLLIACSIMKELIG